MANTKTALKRWRQSLERRDRNRARRSASKTAIRNVRASIASGDEAAVDNALSRAYSALDRAAKKGAIHTGKANRQKRRLTLRARQALGKRS